MSVLGGLARFTNSYSYGASNATVVINTGYVATVTGCNFTNNSAVSSLNSAAVHQTNLDVCILDSGMFTNNSGVHA
jgi:hypothetical protein